MQPQLLYSARFLDGRTIRFDCSEGLAGCGVIACAGASPLGGSFHPGTPGGDDCVYELDVPLTLRDIGCAPLTLECRARRFPIDLTWFYEQPEFDRRFAYEGPLGAEYEKSRTRFRLWSPVASEVLLNLYRHGEKRDPFGWRILPMERRDRGLWEVTAEGDLAGMFYTFTVTTAYGSRESVDPYARAAGLNGERGMVVDLAQTDPAGWSEEPCLDAAPVRDAVIWEVHVRDFSIDESSGMRHKGKYLAFTEAGTTVGGKPGAPATGLDYLKGLGVTHIHLMPVQDFATVDESHPDGSYNWGYDPKNHNVPEGSYSTDPADGAVRIREFKELVLALHRAGLKVVLDVVYNHTYATEDSWLQSCVPDYYYRKKHPDGTPTGRFANASGCGNETASERTMCRRYLLDSLCYWAREYRIDGFRFDLMKVHDVATMNAAREALSAINPDILLYGEGWSAMSPAIPEEETAGKNNAARLAGIAQFNDSFRDAVKGRHTFDGSKGFVNGGGATDRLLNGLEASVGDVGGPWGPRWATRSDEVITYDAAHDNLTLWDKLAGEGMGGGPGTDWNSVSPELLAKNRMAGGLLLTAHGIPFLQAGEEFCRTKWGDGNSYRSPDAVNGMDWTRLETHAEVAAWYRGMLAIRRAFSGFRSLFVREGSSVSPDSSNIYVQYYDTDTFSFTLRNDVPGEWLKVAVAANASGIPATRAVGEEGARWVVIADGRTAGLAELYRTEDRQLVIPPRSVLVAVGAAGFDMVERFRAKDHQLVIPPQSALVAVGAAGLGQTK